MTQVQRDIRRKLRILRHAEQTGNVPKTCRHFGISREMFYRWKRSHGRYGEDGLINSKPCPENPKVRVPAHHIQVDVNFPTFHDKAGRKVRCFRCTAIDDATRTWAS